MSERRRPRTDSRTARHVAVLPREVLGHLDISSDSIVVDGTVGAGGHSQLIVKQLGSNGRLIGIDRDPMMLELADKRLSAPNCHLQQASYSELPDVLGTLGLKKIDAVLLDLGLSSDQLADRSRGFGFDAGGPLDMRFDTGSGRPASDILKTAGEDELAEIFESYGEERHSLRIARAIVAARKRGIDFDAESLATIVTEAVPRSRGRHPATRVFQALRIAVNQELEHLATFLHDVLPDVLKPGGRAVIISFHSLEDRLVKQAFQRSELWCIHTPKPIVATPAEQRMNPRSRSAKLRSARRN